MNPALKIDRLKPYDVLLYRGKGPTGRLVRWGTKSPYSHVAVVVDPRIYLGVESNTGTPPGVRAIDLRKLSEEEVDLFRLRPECSFDGPKVISFLVASLGARYDLWGVIGLALLKLVSFLTGFTQFRGYNRFQKEKDYFCSELVYRAFLAGGLDIVPQIGEAEITSPGDIARSPCLFSLSSSDAGRPDAAG